MTDGANLSPSEFVTWVGTLDAVEQRAWAIALATAFAQRRADEQNELGAAYRAYDHDAGTPVRSDSEFDFAFHLAVAIGETRPLRDHVSSGMPVPQYPVMINGWPVRDAPFWLLNCLVNRRRNNKRAVARSALQLKRSRPSRLSAMRRGWWRLH